MHILIAPSFYMAHSWLQRAIQKELLHWGGSTYCSVMQHTSASEQVLTIALKSKSC